MKAVTKVISLLNSVFLFTLQVLRLLNKRYGELYTESNFILSATHTHGTPGGHLMDLLFDIPSYGFVKEVFDALTSGILKVNQYFVQFFMFLPVDKNVWHVLKSLTFFAFSQS